MAISASYVLVLILGIIVLVLAARGMVSPGSLVSMVKNAMDQNYGMYLAVIVRLILGAALIIVAPVSRFPVAFNVLGWLTLIAAVGVIIVGRERIRGVIAWFAQLSNLMIRLWLMFGMAFAGFLIYGVL
jgi:hypothetical protein